MGSDLLEPEVAVYPGPVTVGNRGYFSWRNLSFRLPANLYYSWGFRAETASHIDAKTSNIDAEKGTFPGSTFASMHVMFHGLAANFA